jgi:hypothetical protein
VNQVTMTELFAAGTVVPVIDRCHPLEDLVLLDRSIGGMRRATRARAGTAVDPRGRSLAADRVAAALAGDRSGNGAAREPELGEVDHVHVAGDARRIQHQVRRVGREHVAEQLDRRPEP